MSLAKKRIDKMTRDGQIETDRKGEDHVLSE